MSQYDAEIDLDNANNSQTQAVYFVGRGKRVLDVGCWKGALGRALIAQDCQVSGLDIDEAAAEVAREFLDEVVVADLDKTSLSSCFPEKSFDVIVFADVLEHLVDPAAVLRDAKQLLRPGGFVVLSIPNIAHGSVRLALLQGLWDYTDTGHLDRTHLRFFSRRGLVDLVRGSGYAIDELRATVVDVLSREVVYDPEPLPPGIIEWVRDQTDAMTFQFLVRAHPDDDAATAAVPPLEPVVPFRTLRPEDRWTEQAEAERTKTHKLLTQRDHIVGLEAATAAARARVAHAETARASVRRRLDSRNATVERLRKRLRSAERELQELSAAPAPRGVLVRARGWVGRRLRRMGGKGA
ncbi:class I SAM-dependent methyltransferase [Nocardioides sp. W7]|uniref:class I SAM-dependent methyltransferase n=1 Tax=Nocardioides sp. W7 TaxID=2931390 RepID=UPI001FD564B9|nr:class I SAM-dependent methyltransferase [Nocardioides sp. W7]